jgi:hypothetical protein
VLRLARVGLVNHGRHDHEAGGAELFAVLHVADCRLRAHFSNAADDRHASGGDFDGVFYHGALFLRQQALILTEGAADDEAMHACLDLSFPKPSARGEVDRLVLMHLRDDGREDAGPLEKGTGHECM